jgi:hypothetical protein
MVLQHIYGATTLAQPPLVMTHIQGLATLAQPLPVIYSHGTMTPPAQPVTTTVTRQQYINWQQCQKNKTDCNTKFKDS